MSERCQHADTVAAYLLGALPQDESAHFETHLDGCPQCREDLATLQPVVDALPAAAPPVQPPLELRARLMDTVRSEAELLQAAGPSADKPAPLPKATPPLRERLFGRRPLLAGAMALVLALAAGYGLRAAVENGGSAPAGVTRTVRAQVTFPNASARVIVRHGVGTLVVTGLPAPPAGKIYQIWLVRPGVAAPAPTNALFGVDHHGAGHTSVPAISGVKEVLVTAEPDGGSPAPTENPVIVAPLS
jgi:anti-sigma factor RsiW